MRAFNVDKDLSSSCIISWNHQEFEVQFTSLADEIKIGIFIFNVKFVFRALLLLPYRCHRLAVKSRSIAPR